MTNPHLTSYSTVKSWKISNKTRMSTLATFIQHSFGSPSHGNQRRTRNKRNPNCKRRSETVTVCRWHDTIHRKFYKCYLKTTELINDFGKVAGYKINTQKPVAFLYYKKERSEREIKQSHLPLHGNEYITYKLSYLRRQNSCTPKTIRHWWKKSKMPQGDGKIYHVLGLEDSILWKWLYPRQSTDSM